jgi:superfamily II DNA or RNA helicase
MSSSDTSIAVPASLPPPFTLRPYQETCVNRVLTRFYEQPQGGRALIVLPTGGGKTIVFTEIARRLMMNTLVIAHRQELLQQAADKFLLADPLAVIGQVGAGRHEYGAPITVASIQTISRPEHLKALQRFGYGLVIIDECHHSTAAGYQAVLHALPDAFILGVTATPDRLDHQSIERIFGAPVFSVTILDLVEQGYLCDLKAIAVHTTTSLDHLHTQAGDFKQDELEEAVDTQERNERAVHAYLTHCQGRQALCFAVSVKHAWHLAAAFNQAGVSASVVSGDTAPEERKHILHAYERGEIEVVCNCGVLTEGYDAPQTSCIVMARPTQSRALYTQCIGRGTRLAPGKTDCIVLDITDNCLKHRLEPLSLKQVLDLEDMRDGESILEAKKRQAREQEAAEQERTTRVMQRACDLTVNILARFDWKRRPSGAYVLEIGEQKHKIILLPSEDANKDGYYSVWARLAPDYRMQQWLKDSPLQWAQQHAEMKARVLQADEKNRVLVDGHAAWRSWPASPKQFYMLRLYGIPFSPTITRGEASDLIAMAKEQEERRKAEQKIQEARKDTRKGKRPRKTQASA